MPWGCSTATSKESAARFWASYQRKVDNANAKRWGYGSANRMCLEHTVLTHITAHPETAKAIYRSVVDQYGDLSESYFLTVLRALRGKGMVRVVGRDDIVRGYPNQYARTTAGTKKLRRLGILP